MAMTEPTAASVRLLGLGSKLYPSNMPRKLNIDLTPLMQNLVKDTKKKGSVGKVDNDIYETTTSETMH